MEKESSIVFLAILGKHNEPKLLKNYTNSADMDTEYNIMVYSWLDFFVDKTQIERVSTNSSEKIESYLGKIHWIFTVEGQLSFYGYLTNTNHKYILVKLEEKIEPSNTTDTYIKDYFRRIQKIFVSFTYNPFMVSGASALTDTDQDYATRNSNQELAGSMNYTSCPSKKWVSDCTCALQDYFDSQLIN